MKATRKTVAERFAAKLVRMPTGCLEWTGKITRLGYGQIKINGKNVSTHRFAWTTVHGSIPDGIHVLHHCDNPPCCDVEHLFLGTRADNMADKIAKGRDHNQRKTHCPAGHEFTAANTYVNAQGHRACRECHRVANIRYVIKMKRGTS